MNQFQGVVFLHAIILDKTVAKIKHLNILLCKQ